MIKSWLKKHLYYPYVRHKLLPELGIQQRSLFHQYQSLAAEKKIPDFKDTGFRVFSQFEEDGKLLFLFSLIGMGRKEFIEFGSDDGINSNSANLIFHHGWSGLFLDGNQKALDRGKRFFQKHPHPYWYKPKFKQAFINAENINALISEQGFSGEIDLLSIDLDGNDFWVWKALDVVSPRVVVIEAHVEFKAENKVVRYDPNYFYPGKHPLYHGASVEAMRKLGKEKGYVLVGGNDLGFNLFFLREDQFKLSGLTEKETQDILWHPSHENEILEMKEIENWEYLSY